MGHRVPTAQASMAERIAIQAARAGPRAQDTLHATAQGAWIRYLPGWPRHPWKSPDPSFLLLQRYQCGAPRGWLLRSRRWRARLEEVRMVLKDVLRPTTVCILHWLGCRGMRFKDRS